MESSSTRARLVVVEDDPDNLEALSMLLEDRYDVFGYVSPTDALAAIEADKPDVVVLDIGMVPLSGVETLDLIRAIPGYRDIPALALTGFARDVDRQAFLAAGFEAVLVKPVLDPFGELFPAIDGLLQPRAAADNVAPMQHPNGSSHPTPGAIPLDGAKSISASLASGFSETGGPPTARLRNGNAG